MSQDELEMSQTDWNRFFFADERTIEGRSASTKINGPGHAEFYYELAQGVGLPWHATFVIGHGYKDFGEIKVWQDSAPLGTLRRWRLLYEFQMHISATYWIV